MAKYSKTNGNGNGTTRRTSTTNGNGTRTRTRSRRNGAVTQETNGSKLKSVASAGSSRTRTRTINGKRINRDSEEYNISSALMATTSYNTSGRLNTEITTDFLSEEFLASIGCSIVQSGKESKIGFSLMETQTDTEVIENENILDIDSFGTLKNEAATLEKRFTNKDDPIYTLDDQPSMRSRTERETSIKKTSFDSIKLSSAIVNVNTKSGNGSTLKQFGK